MPRGGGARNKPEFPMNGPVRDFAFEVAREIAADLNDPVFPAVIAPGKQNLVKTDHGNIARP